MLHYQLKVNLCTGVVLTVEALLRWQHLVEGLLSRSAFMPLLQDSALMVDLDHWVLGAALRQAAHWRDQGCALPVSVNVDAPQLSQPDFVHRLSTWLQAHPQVLPADFSLEQPKVSPLRSPCLVTRCRRKVMLGGLIRCGRVFSGFSAKTCLCCLQRSSTGLAWMRSFAIFKGIPQAFQP